MMSYVSMMIIAIIRYSIYDPKRMNSNIAAVALAIRVGVLIEHRTVQHGAEWSAEGLGAAGDLVYLSQGGLVEGGIEIQPIGSAPRVTNGDKGGNRSSECVAGHQEGEEKQIEATQLDKQIDGHQRNAT